MDCKYFDFVMEKMGFNNKWRGLISECIRTTRISVLVNESHTSEFGVGKGLKQGDPLSLFLFLIAVEGFNLMIVEKYSIRSFWGVRVWEWRCKHFTPPICWWYTDCGKEMLKKHEEHQGKFAVIWSDSGLKVNFHKSLLVGVNIS